MKQRELLQQPLLLPLVLLPCDSFSAHTIMTAGVIR